MLDERTEDCRSKFKECGLTYWDLTDTNLDLLEALINVEIMKYRRGEYSFPVDPIILKCFRPKKKKGHPYELLIKGTYFAGREAVTFNDDGFIGIAGEMSGYNKTPIIDGFLKWCEELRK